jgi:small subunit ribosomal protein S17|tara:strand:- start:10970 stop:11272 length:303 start_codon:yes stop_codon:yes gene_type:complete
MKDKKSIIVKGKPISLRGRTFEGTIINMNLQKTVTVEWQRQYYLPKYERFEKRRTRVKAHKPDSLNVEIGDQVKIMETRPISKTKHFVIVEVMNDESSKS